MPGPARKQRTPIFQKPVGTEFSTLGESKAKEEQKQKINKLPHFVSKKKVILLPGPVADKKD